MSKKHRIRKIVKLYLKEKNRARYFRHQYEATMWELCEATNPHLAELPAPLKSVVAFNFRTPAEGDPREDKAQD